MCDNTLDSDWVLHRLNALVGCLPSPLQAHASLFTPSEGFYACLESGGEAELQQTARDICRYLGLSRVPRVTYQWGLRMEPGVAGQICLDGRSAERIQMPVAYAGKPLAQGAILAHEITHQVLAVQGVRYDDRLENERVTDLASIHLGLGKLVLNGSQTRAAPWMPEYRYLGYIPLEWKVYAYQEVARRFHVAVEATEEGLTGEGPRSHSPPGGSFQEESIEQVRASESK